MPHSFLWPRSGSCSYMTFKQGGSVCDPGVSFTTLMSPCYAWVTVIFQKTPWTISWVEVVFGLLPYSR